MQSSGSWDRLLITTKRESALLAFIYQNSLKLNERKQNALQGMKLSDLVSFLHSEELDADFEAVNSHYEPLQPEAYIRYRVATALKFYRSRIPNIGCPCE